MSNDRINELPIDRAALFNAIAHGDQEHRSWLKEAIDAHFAGDPVPVPRGSGRKEALIKELVEALEEVGASNIRPGSRYNERLAREYERVQRVARAALSKARAQ